MKYHSLYNPLAKTKVLKTENNSRKTRILSPANGNTKLWKSFCQHLVKIKTSILSDPMLHIIPEEMCVH